MTSPLHGNGSLIPNLDELVHLLEVESCVPDYQLVSSTLLEPLRDFLSIEGKKIRTEITEIGFFLSDGIISDQAREQLRICTQIIEGLHIGSMIIDDIQDQSELRRGKPAFHRKYGIGVALNAGNWLYFRSIDQVQKLYLKSEQEVYLQHIINRILLKAHFGQAIDVGVDMVFLPQSQVESAYFTAAELKTGALMSLAFELGAFIAKQSAKHSPELSSFAKRFGVALQIFDDIGNFLSPPPKGMEDFKRGRPSFIWVMASRLANPEDYQRFQHAIRMLPDESWIDSWAKDFRLVPESKKAASQYLWSLREVLLEDNLRNSLEVRDRLECLFKKLENAYG